MYCSLFRGGIAGHYIRTLLNCVDLIIMKSKKSVVLKLRIQLCAVFASLEALNARHITAEVLVN